MTHDELDRLWFEAMEQSIRDGEQVVRYHFASIVAAAEREACAKVCDATSYYQHIGPAFGEVRHGIAACAAAIRARSNT